MSESPNTTRFGSLDDPRVLARIEAAEEGVLHDTADDHDPMSSDELELVIESLRAGRPLDD